MNTLVVYAHPNPESFNHALLESVQVGLEKAGHEIRVKDLYASGFKPTLDADDLTLISQGETPDDVKPEQADVSWAEGLVLIYPLWWHDRPAILKGWMDRVFLNGFAFEYGAQGPTGLLGGKKALVLQTSGNPEAVYDAWETKDAIKKVITTGGLEFFGIRDITYKVFFGVPIVTDNERQAMLEEARALAQGF